MNYEFAKKGWDSLLSLFNLKGLHGRSTILKTECWALKMSENDNLMSHLMEFLRSWWHNKGSWRKFEYRGSNHVFIEILPLSFENLITNLELKETTLTIDFVKKKLLEFPGRKLRMSAHGDRRRLLPKFSKLTCYIRMVKIILFVK